MERKKKNISTPTLGLQVFMFFFLRRSDEGIFSPVVELARGIDALLWGDVGRGQ